MHPLYETLVAAAAGRFPRPEGGVTVTEPDEAGTHAVVLFTGHAFVLSDRAPADVTQHGADGFGGAAHPDVLRWLAGPGGWIGSHDVVLVRPGVGGGTMPVRGDLDDHPRVRRSRAHRREVHVYGDDSGLVTLGTGLVGRLEMSVELLAPQRSAQGAGRRLVSEGLEVVPSGDLVWAQVAPGNAASLRAFLTCGFVPIGAEVLLSPATIRHATVTH